MHWKFSCLSKLPKHSPGTKPENFNDPKKITQFIGIIMKIFEHRNDWIFLSIDNGMVWLLYLYIVKRSCLCIEIYIVKTVYIPYIYIYMLDAYSVHCTTDSVVIMLLFFILFIECCIVFMLRLSFVCLLFWYCTIPMPLWDRYYVFLQ